jgi:hypothetical protein
VEKYCRAGQDTDDNITWRMRTASWIHKATNTHSLHVILIAFPLQQWLHERATMLRYMYTACLVYNRDAERLLRGTNWVFKENNYVCP